MPNSTIAPLTVGSAHDNFGAKPDAVPGCLLEIALGDELGWLMEIRKLEVRLDEQ